MPARVSVTKVCSFVVASVISCRGSGIVGTGLLSLLGRQRHTRWNLTRVDHAPDLGGAARVEVDVALADGRLLRQQARAQQGLARLLRERAGLAREPTREVRELRVVAPPLAHPAEPLEDPAGHAAARVR